MEHVSEMRKSSAIFKLRREVMKSKLRSVLEDQRDERKSQVAIRKSKYAFRFDAVSQRTLPNSTPPIPEERVSINGFF